MTTMVRSGLVARRSGRRSRSDGAPGGGCHPVSANGGPATATLHKITGEYALSDRVKVIICPYPFCDSDAGVASVVRKSLALW